MVPSDGGIAYECTLCSPRSGCRCIGYGNRKPTVCPFDPQFDPDWHPVDAKEVDDADKT